MRVLLIEHDGPAAGAIVSALAATGYEVVRCSTARTALVSLPEAEVILLNLELPEVDGFGLLTELRLASVTPILAYSRRNDVESVVTALQRGADDHMVEPVRPVELVARMKAIIRRAGAGYPEQVVQLGDIEIRQRVRTVEIGGNPVRLTPREFDVLLVLARTAGTAVSRGDIMSEVWGRSSPAISRTLDVHVSALRTKLARPNLLVTVRGFGYRLASNPQP